MKKQIFTLIMLGLLGSVGNVWGADVKPTLPYSITSANTPVVPTKALDLSTQKDFTADGNGWIVFFTKGVVDSKSWWSKTQTNGGSATWTAPSGTKAPFKGGSSTNRFTMNTSRVHAIRFIGAETASFLVHNTSSSGTYRHTEVSLYSYDSGTSTLSAAISVKNAGDNTDVKELVFENLSTAIDYVAYIYGDNSSNSDFYEVALKAPSTPNTPSFSPVNGSTVEQDGTISVTSANATNIYYAWAETENEPETPASWSYVSATDGVGAVPVPVETGTRYLYAYGWNSVGSGTIAHVSYTIITPRTPTTLSFVSPTTTVGVDENVTNVPTLTPAVGGAIFTYESSNEEVATVDENTGEVTGVAVGSATITAHYAGNESYGASDANYTINVVQSAVDTKFWNGGDWVASYSGTYTGSIYIDNMEIKGTSTQGVQITSGGAKTIDGKSVGARIRLGKEGSADGNYLHFKVKPNTKITYWGIRSTAGKEGNALALSFGTFGTNEQTYSMAAGNEECIVYYYMGASDIDVYAYSGSTSGASMLAIKVEPVTSDPSFALSVSEAGWASLFLNYPAEVPVGATAYYASAISNTSITLSPINAGQVIPANTAVVVAADEGDYSFDYSSSSAVAVSTNLFRGANMAIPIASNATYVLSSESIPGSCVFGLYTGSSLGANKAYLLASDRPAAASAPDRIHFIIEGEQNATNVENVEANDKAVKFIENGKLLIKKNGIVYDALGRVVR